MSSYLDMSPGAVAARAAQRLERERADAKRESAVYEHLSARNPLSGLKVAGVVGGLAVGMIATRFGVPWYGALGLGVLGAATGAGVEYAMLPELDGAGRLVLQEKLHPGSVTRIGSAMPNGGHAPDCTNIKNYGLGRPCGCVIPSGVWDAAHARKNTFVPSVHSYGDAAATTAMTTTDPTADPSSTSYLTPDVVDAVSSFLGIGDPQIAAARVEAQIRNLQALAAKSVPPIKTYQLNQISKLQAELSVLRAQAAESAYSTELSRVVRISTAAGSVLTALALFGGVFFVGGLVLNQVQRARVQQAEIKRLQGG